MAFEGEAVALVRLLLQVLPLNPPHVTASLVIYASPS